MAEEKKDNQIPSFATYEKRKVLRKAKALRGWVLHKKSGEAVTDKAVSKEQGTLKTVWGVFKEALATTGKDFKRLIAYKTGESILGGLQPYVQSLLFGSLTGVAGGSVQGAVKFFGAAGAEVVRQRAGDVCRFKARMVQLVLNNTHSNAVLSSVFEDILHKPRPYFKNNAPASLKGVAGEIAAAKNTLLNTSVDCFSRAVIFGISSASLLAVDPKLAFGVLGVTAVTAEFGSYMNGAFRKLNSKLSSFKNRISRDNSDSIKNTPLVQDTNRVESESLAMKNRLEKSSSVTQKVTYAKSKAYLKMRTAISVVMEGLIMTAAFADVLKTGDIGRFALISGAAWQMMGSGNMLSELWTEMQAGTHRLIDATKKLITPKELDRVVGKEKLSEKDTKIRVENVSFAYPIVKDVTDMSLAEAQSREGEINRTETILNDLNVSFDRGELTAVIGTSGNGKSTLMSLIRHDYDPEAGAIYIGDKEIRDISDDELNAHIAFVDQKVHFFDESVAYNLKYFKPDATEEELMQACQMACFDKDVGKFKNGLSYRIGQDGSQLSGGQQQRLALARTFLMDKPIVILDEPTTGLDPELSLKIMKSLKELAKDKTVIMVTHNPTEVALADRVVVVKNGEVTADGKPMNLVKSGDITRSVLSAEDVKTRRRQFQESVNGVRPEQEIAEILKAEERGLTDEERERKGKLLREHPEEFVNAYKQQMKKKRAKNGVSVTKGKQGR